MSNKLNSLKDYILKYQNNQLAIKNLYEIVNNYEYNELTKDYAFKIPKANFTKTQFVNIRNRLNVKTRKNKNPKLQIRLKNFIPLNILREKYEYVIGYDGIDNDLDFKGFEKVVNFQFFKKPKSNGKLCESFIKLVLGKWNSDKTKINKIKTFIIMNSEKTVKHLNGGIENELAVNKLFDLMENWIFEKSKDKELIENYENLNFYIVADKHRTIVSKMNRMLINGFISSNPTTYEKFENQNFKLKEKISSCRTIQEFNQKFHDKIIAKN